MNPKSLENLQPFDQMDTDRHRELSRRGGRQLHRNRSRSDRGHTKAGAIRPHTGGVEQDPPGGVKPVDEIG